MKVFVVTILVVLVTSKPLNHTSSHYDTKSRSVDEDSLTAKNMSVAANRHTQGHRLVLKSSPGSGSRIIKPYGNNICAKNEIERDYTSDLADGEIVTSKDESGRMFHSRDSMILQSPTTSQVEGSRGNTEVSSDDKEEVLHGEIVSESMTLDMMYVDENIAEGTVVEGSVFEGTDIEELFLEILLAN